MKKLATPQKFITTSALTIMLSLMTVILGAPFLRVLRHAFGPVAYWLLGLVVVAGTWFFKAEPLSVLIGSVWMTSGVYSELENKGLGWWISGILSVISGLCLFAATGFIALRTNGINTYPEVEKLMEQFAQKVTEVNPNAVFSTEILLHQIPSAIAILLIVALGVGLIFERRVFSWLNLPREKIASQLKLLEYRLPDYMIWVAMTAFLLTMVSFGGKAIAILAVNVVNVAIVLYFFQGLAVLEVFLNSMRAGVFTRVLTYIILVGQLLLVLSVLGLIDYWVDFRGRIRRIKAPANS
jgi:Predicted membrane protein (DUF2232).